MRAKPLVSICCAAYNHEKYIRQTLDGFLMQEVDFEYEILIHDDASTDKTAQIIKEYELQYPDRIFPIYQTQNQYSQGKKYSDLNYERVQGKYVALCEGDDCWIDKSKLAKQVKAFESNPQCGICFHSAISQNCLTNHEIVIGQYLSSDGIVKIEDIILKKFDMIPTASCMVTKEVLEQVLEYKSTRPYLTVGDLYFQIFGSLESGAIYLNETMSIYRHFTPHSWSSAQASSLKSQLKHIFAMVKSYRELDEMTDYKYSFYFQLSTVKRLFSVTKYNTISDIPSTYHGYVTKFLSFIEELKKENSSFVLYGAGVGAKLILNELEDSIDYLVDRDSRKHNTLFLGKKIYSFEQLKMNPEQKIIISVVGRSEEAIDDLVRNYGIKEEQCINIDQYLIDDNIWRSLLV